MPGCACLCHTIHLSCTWHLPVSPLCKAASTELLAGVLFYMLGLHLRNASVRCCCCRRSQACACCDCGVSICVQRVCLPAAQDNQASWVNAAHPAGSLGLRLLLLGRGLCRGDDAACHAIQLRSHDTLHGRVCVCVCVCFHLSHPQCCKQPASQPELCSLKVCMSPPHWHLEWPGR